MGGKSRKSGGVSRKLISHIKSGKFSSNSSCGSKKTADGHKTLFEEAGDFED